MGNSLMPGMLEKARPPIGAGVEVGADTTFMTDIKNVTGEIAITGVALGSTVENSPDSCGVIAGL